MFTEYLRGAVQRQRFDGMALASIRPRFEQGVVNCFFSGFDYGEKERREASEVCLDHDVVVVRFCYE